MSELLEKIKEKIENLITLEIVTAVGNVKMDGHKLEIDFDASPKVILTKINLLEGDIHTVMHPDYIAGEYQNLKAFHEERVNHGQEIIQKNIAILKDLTTFIKKELS